MKPLYRSFTFLCLVGALCVFAAEPPVVGPAARLTITPSGEIDIAMADGAVARFAPVVAVLAARANPNVDMRWGKFPDAALRLNDTGSLYNVLTWGAKDTGAKTSAGLERYERIGSSNITSPPKANVTGSPLPSRCGSAGSTSGVVIAATVLVAVTA